MPKRSNEFQKLVFIIKQQVAGDAQVTESKFLPDLLTEAKREVDICIEKYIAGHLITISIECRDHKRRADVTWVEQMKSKHERLPTNKLILVSKAGFSDEAKEIAKKYSIETLALEEVDSESIYRLFGELNSVWVKVVTLSPTKVLIQVSEVNDLPSEKVSIFPDNIVFLQDGTSLCIVRDLVDSWLKAEPFMKEILSRGNQLDKYFVTRWENPTDEHGNPFCLRKEEPSVIRMIESIEVTGKCEFKMTEFPLEHGLLGAVKVSWGSGSFMAEDAFLIASEDEVGERRFTIVKKGGDFKS